MKRSILIVVVCLLLCGGLVGCKSNIEVCGNCQRIFWRDENEEIVDLIEETGYCSNECKEEAEQRQLEEDTQDLLDYMQGIR